MLPSAGRWPKHRATTPSWIFSIPLQRVCTIINVNFEFRSTACWLPNTLDKSRITMFPQSSQRRYWIFSDENDLTALREKTNVEFIQRHGSNMTVGYAVFNGKLTTWFWRLIFIYDFYRVSHVLRQKYTLRIINYDF